MKIRIERKREHDSKGDMVSLWIDVELNASGLVYSAGPQDSDPPDSDQVKRAMNFLKKCCPKAKGPWGSSYSLKHFAEQFDGPYISNGALILAASKLGYAQRRDGIGPNTLVYCKMVNH